MGMKKRKPQPKPPVRVVTKTRVIVVRAPEKPRRRKRFYLF